MYNNMRDVVEQNRKIPDGKLYDYIGSAELGMHVFRLTQTAEALSHSARQGYVHDQEQAEEIHYDISRRTRSMAHIVHEQFPEDLPKAQNIDVIRAKNRALMRLKKPEKPDQDQTRFQIF